MATNRRAAGSKASTSTAQGRRYILIPLYIETVEPGDNRPARVMFGNPPEGATVLPFAQPAEHVGYVTSNVWGHTLRLKLTDMVRDTLVIPAKRSTEGKPLPIPGISHLTEIIKGKNGASDRYIYGIYADDGVTMRETHEIGIEYDPDRPRVWRDQTLVRLSSQPHTLSGAGKELVSARATGETMAGKDAAPDVGAMMAKRAQAVALLAAAGISEPSDAQIKALIG